MNGIGLGMGVLHWDGDRRSRSSSFGVNLGRPIVTNGDFVAQLCKNDALFPNYFRERLVVVVVGITVLLSAECLCYSCCWLRACCLLRRGYYYPHWGFVSVVVSVR